MCWFITLIIPASFVDEAHGLIQRSQANDGSKADRLILMTISDKDVAPLVPAGYQLRWFVRGDSDHACSCGMYCDPRIPDDEPSLRDRILDGLRRKGKRRRWSQAKIERAVAQAAQAHPLQENFYGLQPGIRRLIADMGATSGRVGIFVRWAGQSEDDRIKHIRVHHAGIHRLLDDEKLLLPGELLWVEGDHRKPR